MVFRVFGMFFGGEKIKVKFVLIRIYKFNVIIFDEFINYLDKYVKFVLKEVLIKYLGIVILVLYEKLFYEEICDYEIYLL